MVQSVRLFFYLKMLFSTKLQVGISIRAPSELGKLVEMVRLIPGSPSAVTAFWMHLPGHLMEGIIFRVLWLIVGFAIFAMGGVVYTAGSDLSPPMNSPVGPRRTWYSFEGMNTTKTPNRTGERSHHHHQCFLTGSRGLVFHHRQGFFFLPPPHCCCPPLLPTGAWQDGWYHLQGGYNFKRVHTTKTQNRTRKHGRHHHQCFPPTTRGLVFHHRQQFFFLPSPCCCCNPVLPTNKWQDGRYHL